MLEVKADREVEILGARHAGPLAELTPLVCFSVATWRLGSFWRTVDYLWCRFFDVSEQQDVIGDLGEAGVLAGISWAYRSATTRALSTYSEDDGHDAAWLGNTRFTLFRDRLDRVFHCERYAVSSGDDEADLDLLFAELPQPERDSMPRLATDLVSRCNLTGSPGWVHGGYRFLLASSPYGKLGKLPWPQKSPTKQRVAQQRNPEPQPSLFDSFAEEEIAGLMTTVGAVRDLDLATFVVGHSLDPLDGRYELVLGRPRLNAGGGPAWWWCQDLLGLRPADGGRRTIDTPLPTGPNTVPDAPVRVRRQRDEQRNESASGGR